MSVNNNDYTDVTATSEIGADGGKPKKASWDPKGKRNLMFIAGIASAAVILMGLIFAGGEQDSAKASVIPPPGAVNAPSAMGEEDRQSLLRAEEARLVQAKAGGQSAIEQPLEPQEVIPGQPSGGPRSGRTPDQGGPVNGQANGYNSGYGVVDNQPRPPVESDQNRLKGLEDQMATQMAAWGLKPEGGGATAEGRLYIRPVNAPSSEQSRGSQPAASSETPVAANDRIVVPAFEAVYTGSVISSYDSDNSPGVVRVRVLHGPLQGAVLKGGGKKIGEGAQLTFTDMSFNGRAVKISAIALDESTSMDIVEGRYNGRYAQRFLWPVLSAGVSAYAQARAQTGTQVVLVETPGTSTGAVGAQQVPPPSSKQALYAMGAAGAEQINQILNPNDVKDQVVITPPSTVGIMFLEPITSTALDKPVQAR